MDGCISFPKLKASTQMIIVNNAVTVVIAVVFYFPLPLVLITSVFDKQ